MGAYVLRRLLLIIPTLFGIMLINFALTQFVPGGPVEQAIARAQGEGNVFGSFAGQDGSESTLGTGTSEYVGARGLPPEFIAELEREFGFDKPPVERFFLMLGNYMRFDFGESYFRSATVIELIKEKLPVSITLGLWSTLIAYMISIPLGIRKAVKDGTPFDTWTSGAIIAGYAIPGFLFAILLLTLFAGGSYWQIFPLRGLTSDNFETLSAWGKIKDYAGTLRCLCWRPVLRVLRR
jgi:microcin C transport system permease protein